MLRSKSGDKATGGGASAAAKSEQFIVVYSNNVPVNIIAVQKLNENLTIIENSNYSTCQLSPDGKKLICVVEVNKPKPKDESPSSKNYDFDSLEYKQSWGEQLDTITHSSLALFHLDEGHESVVLIEKPGFSLQDPFFYKPKESKTQDSYPKNYAVGCVAWKETPYKLGLIYCTNRPSCLASIEIVPDQTETVEPNIVYGPDFNFAISSPRPCYNPHEDVGCHVLFLERDVGGGHNKPCRLMQICMHELKTKMILNNREKRALNDDKTSYSILGPVFMQNLPRHCYTDDEKHIVFSSDTPLATRPFILNLESGKMFELPFPLADCEIQQIRSDWIVAIGSEPNLLPNVYLAKLNLANLNELKWIPLEDPRSKVIFGMKFETFTFPSRDNPGMLVNCIWTEPESPNENNGATLFLPHGGPHSVLPASYYRSIALYTQLGLKTCLINYVGSTGVDHDYVDALLGKIGTSDVHDCVDAIQYAVNVKKIDPKKIILSGGSHGGFLVTHLSGQYSDMEFLACIARNPVIDIPSLVATSDIPDWACAESLGFRGLKPFEEYYANNMANLQIMRTSSPIDHVHKVKVPTLMMLGTKDLRVPLQQGLLWHKLIKSRGVNAKCLIYDDVHALAKIGVEFDGFVNIAKFIGECLFKD